MTIQKQVILRYRGEGHVRFQIPEPMCRDRAAQVLVAELSALEGVDDVKLFGKQRKLAIRFSEYVIDFQALAIGLSGKIGRAHV